VTPLPRFSLFLDALRPGNPDELLPSTGLRKAPHFLALAHKSFLESQLALAKIVRRPALISHFVHLSLRYPFHLSRPHSTPALTQLEHRISPEHFSRRSRHRTHAGMVHHRFSVLTYFECKYLSCKEIERKTSKIKGGSKEDCYMLQHDYVEFSGLRSRQVDHRKHDPALLPAQACQRPTPALRITCVVTVLSSASLSLVSSRAASLSMSSEVYSRLDAN
jgi:hypothetical protein